MLRLLPNWRIIPTDDAIDLTSPFQDKRLRLSGFPPDCLLSLLEVLRDGVETELDLAEAARQRELPPELAADLISSLRAHGAITTRLPARHDGVSRYDRQVRFFDAFATPEHEGEYFNDRLRNSGVAIVGLGGYGTWLALLCARIGIKTIVGIDHDRVELSNLHRQIIYGRDDIGKLKIDACRAALSAADESVTFRGYPIRVRCVDDLLPYLDGVDLIFNAFGYAVLSVDEPSIQRPIVQAALRAGTACLTMGASGIGPLTVPGLSACYWCLLANQAARELVARSDVLAASTTVQAAFGPRLGIITSIAVWEAARFLAGVGIVPSREGLIVLDTIAYRQHRFIPLRRTPDCPMCGRTSPPDAKGGSLS